MMTDTTILNARVTKAFKRRANIIAAHEGVSLSEWLRRIVEKKVAESESLFFVEDDSQVNHMDNDKIAPSEPQPVA